MIDIRTFEEKPSYKALWEVLTNTISYVSIFGIFLTFLTFEYDLPQQEILLFFLMGLVVNLLLSITSRTINLLLGNIVFIACTTIPLIVLGTGYVDILWPIIAGITLYVLLNTLYQIILRQRSQKIRGYLFIAMHIFKVVFIGLFYYFITYLHNCSGEDLIISGLHLTFNCPQVYIIVNLITLILNLTYSIINLFDQNSRLFTVAQDLKEICSWSLDETILEEKLLRGYQDLTRQRRTVLFGDIRGFTEFSETYSHTIVAIVLQDFYETVEEITESHSAYKPEFIADEFVTFFASLQEAVDCALELREALRRKLKQYKLTVGMGLHEGSVLEGIVGGRTSKKYSIIGSAANIASRLQSQAKGNQILCSKRICQKVTDITTEEVAEVRLKGIKGYFKTYNIKGKQESNRMGDLYNSKQKSNFFTRISAWFKSFADTLRLR
jgi:class 3 adenylate cyclase